MIESFKREYSYNFDWMGLPIIQYPEDIIRVQELIFDLRPDCIIETGIARGGSLMLSASVLALLDLQDIKNNTAPIKREVIGVDIDIRAQNKEKIQSHFLSDYVTMVQGSSINEQVFSTVKKQAERHESILVLLDSNHSHAHVLEELKLYSRLVAKGGYIVVFDTVAEFIGVNVLENRPWGVGNNPMTAVDEFLALNTNFKIDSDLNNLSTISCNQKDSSNVSNRVAISCVTFSAICYLQI